MTSEPKTRRARRGPVGRVGAKLLDLAVRVRTSPLRQRIPKPLRDLAYHLLPQQELETRTWEAAYRAQLASVTPAPLRTSVTLGIIKDAMFRFGNYEAACLELGVPYKLIDIASPDWIEQVEESDCAGFLAWPSHVNSVSKNMFDERLRVLAEDMGRVLFPSFKSLWLYESKRRAHDWLKAHGVPHPRTWAFFEREQALDFVADADYPLVFKTDLGSTASGVEIVRNRPRARKLVNLCFGRGYLAWRSDHRDREWGHVLFQEYIHDAEEWRMVRIGRSFFGHRKVKQGDFHSGTRLVTWERPPDVLLDFARAVTDKGEFLSMDLDVLEGPDSTYLVNELHPVFGSKDPEQMYVDGKTGRFKWAEPSRSWRFEEGNFCRNLLCNLRVQTLLELLGHALPEPVGDATQGAGNVRIKG